MFTPFIFREQALGQVRLNVYDLVFELFPLVGDTTISLPERRAVAETEKEHAHAFHCLVIVYWIDQRWYPANDLELSKIPLL